MLSSISGFNGASNFAVASLNQKFQAKFEKADSNGDGRVGRDEAAKLARRPEQAEQLFEQLDVDGDGAISRDEHSASYQGLIGALSQAASTPSNSMQQMLLQQLSTQQGTQSVFQLQSGLAAYQAMSLG